MSQIIRRFSEDEFKIIEEGIKNNLTNTEISKILNRCKSSIKNEILSVCRTRKEYTAEKSIERRRLGKIAQRTKCVSINSVQEEEIKKLIKEGYNARLIRREFGISYGLYQKIKNSIPAELINSEKKSYSSRLSMIEKQIEIIFEILREMKNG